MDWAANGEGNRNPVARVNRSKGLEVLEITALPGAVLDLDASASFDPDGDALNFRWWHMPESGTWEGEVEISGADTESAVISVPEAASGKTIHVICEISDDGTPVLTSYRRVIIKVR